MELEICYEDADLIAVHKPAGLLVHRTRLDRSARTYALQTVRNMVGHHVFPVHRLDKPTSGVLLFAKRSEVAQQLGTQFAAHSVQKFYLAVVRGFPPEAGCIDRPLKVLHDKTTDGRAATDKEPQPAQTAFVRLATSTLPVAIGRFPTARYALLALQPTTGRQHQIRRHLNGISHPVLGDNKHGDYRHNRLMESFTGVKRLCLHAAALHLMHPGSARQLTITAPPDDTFIHLLDSMRLTGPIPEDLSALPFPLCHEEKAPIPPV